MKIVLKIVLMFVSVIITFGMAIMTLYEPLMVFVGAFGMFFLLWPEAVEIDTNDDNKPDSL